MIMKITAEDFKVLQEMMAPNDTAFHRDRYKAAGYSTVRYQWDLARHSGAMKFVCDKLYSYLNDSHIQSAFNKIIRPL